MNKYETKFKFYSQCLYYVYCSSVIEQISHCYGVLSYASDYMSNALYELHASSYSSCCLLLLGAGFWRRENLHRDAAIGYTLQA